MMVLSSSVMGSSQRHFAKALGFHVIIALLPGINSLVNSVGDGVQGEDDEGSQVFGLAVQLWPLTQSPQRLGDGAAMLAADLARTLGIDDSTQYICLTFHAIGIARWR